MQKLLNLRHALFVALLTWCVQVLAQNPNFTYTNTILDVTFVNTAFLTGIAKDDGSGYFTTPDWTYKNVNPVAYVSGTKLKVKARFKFTCKPTGTVYVKGVNADGYTLPPVALTFNQDTEGDYEGETKAAFPVNVVNAFEKFTISWQMSTDVNLPYTTFATSVNPLYVLYQTPNKFTTPFYTCIHIGCKNAARQSVENKIVDEIYKEFTDQCVERVQKRGCMRYWGPLSSPPSAPTDACFSTAGLLQNGDARCGAWARFFTDILKLQGILNSQIIDVTKTVSTNLESDDIVAINFAALRTLSLSFPRATPNSLPAYFFVKRWNVEAGAFKNFYGSEPIRSYNSLLSDSDIDLTGNPAQNNDNPWSAFIDHAIVRYNGKFYDPSYGTAIKNNLEEWEYASIDGFGSVNTMLVDYLTLSDKIWFGKKNNDRILDLVFTVIPY